MKKLFVLPLLVAALQFAACTNEDESIFEQSAAERLEAGRDNYFQTLCDQGGTWLMEYFSNIEEPGYLFILQFEPDKSVTIHTDHKWIDAYSSEKSLWDVINDNGNVLTFNSYNTLFHIFSSPENIVGPNAPLDDNHEDIDELGYGHNGDYEFMLMENDGQTIRLRGKKRALYAYLRRLPADVDIQAYLAEAAALRNQFDAKRFPTYLMTETATGALYDVTGLSSGVVTIVPKDSDNPIARTVTRPCIITSKGMRPQSVFDVIREDDSHLTVSEFNWEPDGTLTAPGVRITATTPATNLARTDLKTWNIIDGSMSAELMAAMEAASEETKGLTGNDPDLIDVFGAKPVLKNFAFGYETVRGKVLFCLKGWCGDQYIYYYGAMEALENGNVKFTFDKLDDPLSFTIIPASPKTKTFIDMFAGEYKAENIRPFDASEMTLTSVSNPDVSFKLSLKK